MSGASARGTVVRGIPYHCKVILMGESAVGKTSLIRRYVDRCFEGEYLTTLGAAVSKRIESVALEGGGTAEVRLLVWDVVGQRGYMELLREVYFPGAQGALAVFDLTRWETLEGLRNWIEVAQKEVPAAPIIVLGNKADMVDRWAVTNEEAVAFCEALGLPYLPTSARTGLNVDEVFKRLSREALRRFASLRPE